MGQYTYLLVYVVSKKKEKVQHTQPTSKSKKLSIRQSPIWQDHIPFRYTWCYLDFGPFCIKRLLVGNENQKKNKTKN